MRESVDLYYDAGEEETLFQRPQSLFFLVADGVLHAKVCYKGSGVGARSLNILYRYCSKGNTWEEVYQHSSILSAEGFQVVYLDQIFYFIHTEQGYVHRYSIKPGASGFLWGSKKLPNRLCNDYGTITTYMGRILVYGPYEEGGKCNLQVYDPVKDMWTEAMRDTLGLFYAHFEIYLPPIIMQHNGSCYRVAFNKYYNIVNRKPSEVAIVHELKTQLVDGVLSVELGEELDQSLVPISTLGAFQIDDDLFVCGRGGFVYKSGLKAWEGEWKDSDLEMYEKWRQEEDSNIVMFTFDSRLAEDEDEDDDENGSGEDDEDDYN